MKKFISFLSLALIAMLSFNSCSGDNNEPSNTTPPNYLNSKTFQEGEDPKPDDKHWKFVQLRFTDNNKGILLTDSFEKGVLSGKDLRRTIEAEFEYTYVKPILKLTITKIIKSTRLENGTTTENPTDPTAIGVTKTIVVDETLNTLTAQDEEDTVVFILKK